MQSTLILYSFLALLLSVSIAYFQYYYQIKNRIKVTPILFVLKAVSLFLLLLLFINPIIEKTEITNIKPVLSVLVDNSISTSFFKEDKNVADFMKAIDGDRKLQSKFDIEKFRFGTSLQVLDSLSFKDVQTNISDGILGVQNLQKDKISPIILISEM